MEYTEQSSSAPQQHQQRPVANEIVMAASGEPVEERRHDALIIGNIDSAVWDHQLRLTTGHSQKGIQYMRWVTPTAPEPFGKFADRVLFRNLVGAKDEAAVLPGRIDGVKRGNDSAVENSIVWIDLDQGIFCRSCIRRSLPAATSRLSGAPSIT